MKKTKMLAMALGALSVPMFSTPVLAEDLEQVIREAIQSNPQVRASSNELNARQEELGAARGGYYPSLDVTATGGREYTNNPYTRSTYGNDDFYDLSRSEANVTLRQPVFTGFATTSEVERQSARLDAAQHAVNGDADAVALQTAEAYIGVLRARDIVTLADGFVRKHQEIYDRIQERSRSGVGRRADVDQAQGRLALAQANLIAAQANLRDAQANYQRVVGSMPPATLEAVPDLARRIPLTLEQAIEASAGSNPDLMSAQSDVAAAQAENRASGSTYYPNVDVVLNRRWGNDLDGVEGDDEDYGAYVEMRWNLFNGGSDAAQKRASAYRVARSQDVRDDTYRQVTEAMRIEWNAHESIKQQIPSLQQHADASVRTRDAYQQQFNLGQRSLLDLLDTENELFDARRTLISAEYNRIRAQYRILNVMGKLRAMLIEPEANSNVEAMP